MIDMYSNLLFFSSIIFAIMSSYSLIKHKNRFSALSSLVCIAITIYILGYALELRSQSFEEIQFFLKVQYFGLSFVPFLWFLICYRLQFNKNPSFRISILTFIIPIITLFLNTTNEFHHLYYKSLSVLEVGEKLITQIERGPWYYVTIGYSYLMIIFGVYVFLSKLKKSDLKKESAAFWVLLGPLFVALTTTLYALKLSPYGIDIVPIGFIIMGITYFTAIFKYNFLEVKEVIRNTVFSEINEGIIVTDTEGKILDFNKSASNIFDWLVTDNIGEELNQFEEGKEISKNKLERYEYKKYNLSKEEYYEVILSDLKEGNKKVGTVYIFQNITRRKNVELDLIKAKKIAVSANKAKSNFLANMSHEIRTPMNSIIGFSDLLLDTNLHEKQKRFSENIKSSAQTLLEIINDILDFSKIEAGKLELESIKFNLEEKLNAIKNLFLSLAEKKGIEIIKKIDTEVPKILIGDPLRFSQVLINIISNAVKFTDKGYVLIEVKTIEKKELKCKLKISIKDTGIGISKEQKEKLFKAFTQVDGSITRKYGGTGLGLVISKNLITKMNGDIKIESELGKGTNFYITAEFGYSTEEDFKIIKNETTENENFEKKLNILLAEDQKINQELINEILLKYNFKIDIANNGKEAVEKANENIYDLILMDLQMPEMDGYEATAIIRNKYSIEELPIIAITAHAFENIKKECIEKGMNDYISKPIAAQELIRKIKKNIIKEIKILGIKENDEIKSEIKLKEINFEEAIKIVNGNKELLKSLIKEFIDTHKEFIKTNQKNIEEKKYEELKKEIHALKGISGNLRMENIFHISQKIELAITENNKIEINKYFEELEKSFNRLYKEIEALLKF